MSIQVLSIVGWRRSLPLRFLSALALAFVAVLPLSGLTEARAETRTLKLYFIHTKERAEITYKRNGRYIQSGLNEVNRFLRDWRQNEPTKMDPQLIDLLWETYQTVRARDYIHVVSAYRSPKTNTMLRSRSSGVAQKSQHTLGRAIDFYIPGVSLKTLRDAGLKLGGGGVGYYPKSGSPFVHLDVGNVRHWPRMSRGELVSVFPNGRTLHVPSDGKPLPGYDQAMAAYQARKKGGGSSVQIASTGGGSSASSGNRRSGGLLATLFGGGADEEEDGNAAVAFAREPEPTQRGGNRPQRNQPAQQRDNRGEPLPGVQAAPVVAAPAAPPAPVAAPAPAEPEIQTPEQIIAALSPRAVPLPEFAPRPKADVAPVAVAAAPAPAPAPAANTLDAQAQAIVAALASPAEIPDAARETIIAGVPIPSFRPEREAAGEAVVAEAPASAESDAAAEIRRSAIAALIAKASQQQADVAALKTPGDEVVLAAFAPLPERRPTTDGSGGPLAELVAAMPQVRPDVVLPQQIRAGVLPTLKGGRVVASTAPDAALQAKPVLADGQPTGSIVKTTAKASKPGPSDQKADRKPVVMPVEEVASRWALETAGRVTRSIASAKEPSLAYNAIRTAPKQVYTAGFAPVEAEPDPARFSGNAVTFLGVARFDTN